MDSQPIRLSINELEYLRKIEALSPALVDALREAERVSAETYAIDISLALAEDFRSVFTQRLAAVGFGPSYELTDEGKMLEELIDRFYF